MTLPFSPYLSQILMKLLETLISPQGIGIYIYVCSACELILFLFGTINFTTKDQLQRVWTGFFCVVDRLGLVFKGPVAVPEYLKWSRLVAVASCLVLRGKKMDLTGLKNTALKKRHQPFCKIANAVTADVSTSTVRNILAHEGYHRRVAKKVPYL